MKSLKQTYSINAPLEKVWRALTNPKIINDWGGGPAKMSDKEGFEFEFWGGDIWGKNIKVIKDKQLVQEWTSGKWEKPSTVTFNLSEKSELTELELIQEGIPDNEASEIDDGWKRYYLTPLKKLLEE